MTELAAWYTGAVVGGVTQDFTMFYQVVCHLEVVESTTKAYWQKIMDLIWGSCSLRVESRNIGLHMP